MTKLGSTFVSEDPDSRGQVGPAGEDSTVPGPAGEDSTVPGPAGVVASVVAGTNIDNIDATDPANPIINAAASSSPTTTQGDVIQRGASVDERLAIGTANQVLAVNSGATALEYVTPAAGALNLSSVTNVDSGNFSGSSSATKGITYNCINAVTIKAIQVPTGTDSSATYKLVIAEVSGATDVIDVITATSSTTATTTAVNPTKVFIFSGGVNLVATKRYAFLMVRTDGTSTAICRVETPTSVGHNITNLEYVARAAYNSNDPQVSDATRGDTSNSTKMILTYSVD